MLCVVCAHRLKERLDGAKKKKKKTQQKKKKKSRAKTKINQEKGCSGVWGVGGFLESER